MLESTFHEDWDEMGTKMVKKGHLLPKSGINSKLVRCQTVKNIAVGQARALVTGNYHNSERIEMFPFLQTALRWRRGTNMCFCLRLPGFLHVGIKREHAPEDHDRSSEHLILKI